MSADNGIYITSFPARDNQVEYRVAHAQNIEDCDHWDWNKTNLQNIEFQDAVRASVFGKSLVYTYEESSQAADDLREKLEKAWEASGIPFPFILEYGICRLSFDRPLVNYTDEEIKIITSRG